jgi:hypothetical protein
MEFTDEQKYKLLTLANYISKFLTDKGIKPACPTIDAEKILLEDAQHLTFYVNPHNLGWFADIEFRKVHGLEDEYALSLMSKYSEGSILVTSVREITLNSIGI